MDPDAFAGIVHHDRDGSLAHFPLEEVRVDAFIVDVSARVNIYQVFTNPSANSTSRAKYVFPVPACAAVCAFEMHLSNGRLLIGVAKEKAQANAEHEQAVREGKITTLVEWETDDVFTISLGSIPGNDSVTTVLTYVMDLMDDESTQHVRFQVPMCVGQRYGQPPVGTEGAIGPSLQTRIRINAYVQMRGLILPRDVISPSHLGVTVVPYQTHLDRPSRHRVSVKFRSRQFLYKDFVLRIQSAGLDAPRCFVERDGRGTAAMQLTLMPHFDLPPVAAQEYLFLVDRSGSMSGSRIQTAKQTLILLLRTLPSSGTSFNIFSFGNRCDSRWPHANVYTQATLDAATQYVESMNANYGGTEIPAALLTTLQSRSPTIPTAVFVLTDGESYHIDECINVVANAVAASTATAPLRIFTLGIGDTASAAMCEGIARAGNGVCLMTTTSEGIVGKCAKLVRAGRSFLLKNVTIDWGISSSLQVNGSDGSPAVRFTAQDQVIRQTPSHIESIYPGFRLVVFALINSDKFVPPREIILRAQRDGTGDALSFRIPVERVRLEDHDRRHHLIHTLAARRLILELDDPGTFPTMSQAERVASVIRLGEQYHLASRHTSFVAVDGLESNMISERLRRRRSTSERHVGESWGLGQYLQWALDFATVAIPTFAQTWFGPPISSGTSNDVDSGNEREHPPRPNSPLGFRDSHYGDDVSDSDRTFTTLSSLEGDSLSDWSETESRPPTPPPDDPEYVRSPSPELIAPRGSNNSKPQPIGSADPLPLDDSVEHLVRLQSYDGSFRPTAAFAAIVGEEALVHSDELRIEKQLWATILAIAYFQKRLRGHPELLESLVEKAYEYVGGLQASLSGRVSIPVLLERAKTCI